MCGDRRDYSLDVSEYLFRLTTEGLRLHSNETQRYQSLTSLVEVLAGPRAARAIAQHDTETLREHLKKIPTEGPVRIHLQITKSSEDNLMMAKRKLAEELGADLTVGDAISMLLFNYVVEQNASKLLAKIGIEGSGLPTEGSDQPDDGGNVVPLR